jgi:hypothetical protein
LIHSFCLHQPFLSLFFTLDQDAPTPYRDKVATLYRDKEGSMVVKTPSIGSNHSTSSRRKTASTAPAAATVAAAAAPIPALSSAESQDVDDIKPCPTSTTSGSGMSSIFQQLLHSMNPVQCLSPTVIARCSNPLADDDDDNGPTSKVRPAAYFAKEVPPLLKDLEHEGKLRTTALQKLYRMTDKDNQKNRYECLSSSSYRCVHLGGTF